MPTSLTNAEKLSLPENTPVGTQVQVTDGFAVSGTGIPETDGLWIESGTYSSRPYYTHVGTFGEPTGANCIFWEGSWQWTSLDGLETLYSSEDDVAFPWLVTTWVGSPTPTLTHPAVQQLAAPSTAQGGVFVAGGSQDGVYAKNLADGQYNGKDVFLLLGNPLGNPDAFSISWTPDIQNESGGGPSSPGFILWGDGGAIYYSLSDVATPDLATNWKNASDDSPASITVTSVSVGELNAGVTSSGAGDAGANFVKPHDTTPVGGRNAYFNIIHDPAWSASGNGGGYFGNTDPAFPWQTTFAPDDGAPPAPTVTRNDVASEMNWEVITLPDPPTGLSYSSVNVEVGTPITRSPAVTGTVDTYSGSLPAGLSLNSTTGQITGTPTTAGSALYTITATNAGGSTTYDISITVTEPVDPPAGHLTAARGFSEENGFSDENGFSEANGFTVANGF